MKVRDVVLGLVAVAFTIIFSACETAVAPEDIYHYEPEYPQEHSAQNITVMDTSDGIHVSGEAVSLVFVPPTANKFHVEVIPEGTEVSYTIDKMPMDSDSGAFYMQAVMDLGDECRLPAQLPMQGSTNFNPKLYRPFPDALGSQNVTVAIDDAVGHTAVAGLTFRDPVVMNVWEDGVVEVDQEGIEATDAEGAVWVSRDVSIEGIEGVVMIRK